MEQHIPREPVLRNVSLRNNSMEAVFLKFKDIIYTR